MTRPPVVGLRRQIAAGAQEINEGVPFFATGGRFQRGAAPASDSPEDAMARVYVPIYKGLSLTRPSSLEAKSLFEPALLTESQAAPFLKEPKAIEAWLGSASEGALPVLVSTACSISGRSGFWLLELSHLPEQPTAAELGFSPDAGVKWEPLREGAGISVCDALAADDYAGLLATARGMALWHQANPFCALCGSPTEPVRAGKNRQCTNCGARVRPRIDPSMIVLVTKGSRCLLARNSKWKAGRFSALAGFIEYGETIEECVAREVKEETGSIVEPSSIRFVASQPWLFPQTFLLGFICETGGDEITIDTEELQDAKWFHKDEVKAILADNAAEEEGRVHVPSRVSLANTLMQAWVNEG